MHREFWEGLTGSTVCDKYPLRLLIGSTGRSAVYVTSRGPNEESAALKLALPFEGPVEMPRVEHARILQLFDTGTCEVGHSYLRYFVTEVADGNLAAAVAAKPLSPAEMRTAIGPVLEALGYLHSHGMAHGAISLSNILTVGDSVKLSADSIRPEDSLASAAKDMRALGLAIVEALTQTRQPTAVPSLPQPFQDMVRGSLHIDPTRQWTALQVAERLLQPTLREMPVTPEETPVAARKTWISLAAATALVSGCIFVLVHGGGSSVQPGKAPPHEPPPVARPAEALAGKPEPLVPVPPPAAEPSGEPKAEPSSAPKEEGLWCVVAGSFSSRANADHAAQQIKRKWPQFSPRVLPPSGGTAYYLVTIGSGLSADTAKWWRQRAVASGMPADTYVKKYAPSTQ